MSYRISLVGTSFLLAMCMVFTLFFAGSALAGDYYSSVPYPGGVMVGAESEGAMPADKVPGKEYSHTDWFSEFLAGGDVRLTNREDHDAFAGADPGQTVSWDGRPGPPDGNSGSVDAFDYIPSLGGNGPTFGEVDAMANRGDFLLGEVVRNRASLLFSVTADIGAAAVLPTGPFDAKAHVHYEDPAGGDGVWAAIEAPMAGPGPGPGVNHHTVEDLDALEIWGPDPPSHVNGDTTVVEGYDTAVVAGVGNTADADRFSLDMDAIYMTSVFAYDIPTKTVAPYIPHAAIVDAVEDLFLGEGLDYDQDTRHQIDVDGTMVRDVGVNARWDRGDHLLFTIDPIDMPFFVDPAGAGLLPAAPIDGGEIMHLVNMGPGLFSIGFLKHGGHVWDTAFPVAATFGYLFEDVDALEAVGTLTGDIGVPEPASMMLMMLGLVTLVGNRRRS